MDLEPCGIPAGCLCSGPILHLISCANITVFPLFPGYIKPGVVHLDLYKTRVVELPPFSEEDWPNLKVVDVRENDFLDCSSLQKLESLRPEIRLYTRCDSLGVEEENGFNETSPSSTANPTEHQRNDEAWMIPLVVLSALLLGTLSGLRECRKSRAWYEVNGPTRREMEIVLSRETTV